MHSQKLGAYAVLHCSHCLVRDQRLVVRFNDELDPGVLSHLFEFGLSRMKGEREEVCVDD